MLPSFKKVGIPFLLFIATYFPTLQWMWERWFAYDSYYSHGILIPLTTALLIWQKRRELSDIEGQPSAWGMKLFVIGLFIHLVSLMFRVYFTSGFSMIIVIAGFVLSFWGKETFKKILFPIVFLIFMVPLPLVFVINLSFGLKMLSAQMAGFLLNVMNIPAVQEGSFIRMPHATVIVEDVCSGLRSLIALLALGAIFSHWMQSGRIKKAVLFFSSIPIAMVTNTFRILVLAIISEFWGTKYITGFVHDLCGILVFVLAFLFLYELEEILK